MRKSISKRLRILFIAITIIMMGVSLYLLLMTINFPGVREEKVTLLSYNNKANVQYEVFLKPNALYDGEVLKEGGIYLTSFVNSIKTGFLYEFHVDKAAEIKGDYEVLAVVEGYTTEEEKVKTIWKKDFVLLPKTEFQNKDTKTVIGKEINVSLDEYNLFVTQINEATKINMPVKLAVMMNINLQAAAGGQIIKKSYSPAITIPLDTNYFEIAKSGIEEKTEEIEDVKKIQLPVNQNLVIVYGILLGLGVLALLYILIFVKGDAPVDILKKRLNKIFKVHGSRLVAINSEIGTSFGMYYKVKSIEDLVRIADELGKPIMYKYSSDPKEITKFYIHDDKSMYAFNLLDALTDIDEKSDFAGEKKLSGPKEIPLE